MNQTQTPTDPGEVILQGTARRWFPRVRLRIWIILSVILAVVVSPLIFRQYRVSQIPLIPEPFDLQEFAERYHIPGSENAYVEYKKSLKKLDENPLWQGALQPRNIAGFKWEKTPSAVKQAVEANQEALELWMQGTKKPRAVSVPPDQLKIYNPLIYPPRIRGIMSIAVWKQLQLQDVGDLEGSWKIIDAGLRTSVHLMQGITFNERLTGCLVHLQLSPQLSRWSEDPNVSVDQLRSSLANLRDRQQSIPPVSETVKGEYFVFRSPIPELRQAKFFGPGVIPKKSLQTQFTQIVERPLSEFGYRLIDEYEFSRRFLRQLLANWIQAADLPPVERRARQLNSAWFSVFQHENQSEDFLSAERLSELGQQTILGKWFVPSIPHYFSSYDRDQFLWTVEELILALQIYYRIHQEFPEDLKLLVPEVLEKLPKNQYGDEPDPTFHYRKEEDHVVIWSEGEYEPVPLEEGPTYVVSPHGRSRQAAIYFTIYPPGTRAPLYRPYPPEFEEELKKKKEAEKSPPPGAPVQFAR